MNVVKDGHFLVADLKVRPITINDCDGWMPVVNTNTYSHDLTIGLPVIEHQTPIVVKKSASYALGIQVGNKNTPCFIARIEVSEGGGLIQVYKLPIVYWPNDSRYNLLEKVLDKW